MNGLAVALLNGLYGVAAFVACLVAYYLYSMRRVPTDARRWIIELEGDIHRLINAHVEVAVCDLVLAEKIQALPKNLDAFEHPILTAGQLGFVVQAAVRARCEQLGVAYPKTWQQNAPIEAEPVTIDAPGSQSPLYEPPAPYSAPAVPQLPQQGSTSVLPPPALTARPGPAFVLGPDGRMVPRARR